MTTRKLVPLILLLTLPLIQSCAGVGANKNTISKDEIEIINEQYVIDEIGADRYVHYKGVIKNWTQKDVFGVMANFVGFDKAGVPAVSFKQRITDKLPAGAEQQFEFRKTVTNTTFDRFKSQITYLDKKPSFLDSITPAHLRDI